MAILNRFSAVPKGPKIENFHSRMKFSISLEIFNPDLRNSPQKIGVWWVARLKFSISLENFKILIFFNLWALRDSFLLRFDSFFASRCGSSGDSRPAIPGVVGFAIRDSVPLRSGLHSTVVAKVITLPPKLLCFELIMRGIFYYAVAVCPKYLFSH